MILYVNEPLVHAHKQLSDSTILRLSILSCARSPHLCFLTVLSRTVGPGRTTCGSIVVQLTDPTCIIPRELRCGLVVFRTDWEKGLDR